VLELELVLVLAQLLVLAQALVLALALGLIEQPNNFQLNNHRHHYHNLFATNYTHLELLVHLLPILVIQLIVFLTMYQ